LVDDDFDTGSLRGLAEHSADLHSGAIRLTRSVVAEHVESVDDSGSGLWRPGLVVSGTAAALLAGAGVGSAASGGDDVKALQTAASIENLAVAVYGKALTLPFIKHGNKVVVAFIKQTMKQHTEHAGAFNSAAVQAGGKPQHGTDPKYQKVVNDALPTIKGPADVVGLAISLEDVAAQTYTANVSQVSTKALRLLFGSVAPVEAQHKAVLLAVQALLKGGAPELIAIPTKVDKLPAAAGSVGFPDSFYHTDKASPIDEGPVA
jgi:ferritin-like protein